MITKAQFQELDNELNELLAEQDEYVEGSDITKRAVEIQSLIWDYPREPDTYYCKPRQRAADDPWETLTVCPACGQTSDYCQTTITGSVNFAQTHSKSQTQKTEKKSTSVSIAIIAKTVENHYSTTYLGTSSAFASTLQPHRKTNKRLRNMQAITLKQTVRGVFTHLVHQIRNPHETQRNSKSNKRLYR